MRIVRVSDMSGPSDLAAAQGLLEEYLRWVVTLEPFARDAATFAEIDREPKTIPALYAPPFSGFLMATVDGIPAGCIALLGSASGEAEVRRLYVRPRFRDRGIGKALAIAVVELARQAGHRVLALESHRSMASAHRMYEAIGFRVVDPPAATPSPFRQVVVFMRLRLDDPS
jgi:putative acetyltransferase